MPEFSALADLGICMRCTGRIFATVGESLDNLERGRMLMFTAEALFPGISSTIVEEKGCPICRGIFSDLERYFDIVMEELGEVEFSTFLVGSIFDPKTLASEARLQESFGGRGEPIKKEFNREFGKYFSSRTGKEVDFKNPDVTINVNTTYDFASAEIRSLFFRGRYNKTRRDMPQTRWIHNHGNDESVESYIGKHALDVTEGKNYYLHAAGREDVDVRMLGNGRDFVLEVSSPKKRNIDLEGIKDDINSEKSGIQVSNLEICDREAVREVKATTYDKTYRVTLSSTGEIDRKRLESALESITGKVIYQRTPLRVAARRADLVRKRSVRESSIEGVNGDEATILITAESGTYIKELVNGDEGRTKPSLSAAYGDSLKVAALDVMEINRGN